MRVAVAASSQLAAAAAGEMARLGGNAVDAAIAAALVSANTEPGVCALAGGAYATIWVPGSTPVTLDGQVRMPGAGLPAARMGGGAVEVELAYGGGIRTQVDAGAVGVPAALAALQSASQHYGALPWRVLFEPVIDITRRGFPLPTACHHYLGYSGDLVFGRSAEGHGALHDATGKLRAPGEPIIVPGLAESLADIATHGAASFYRGDLAAAIVDHVQARGGMLTLTDMNTCKALPRPALRVSVGDWDVATNPPPAIGGAILAAMLLAGHRAPAGHDSAARVARLVAVQRLALDFRRRQLDGSDDIPADVTALLALARQQGAAGLASPSTVHVSASDIEGRSCAITLSAGYGSGLIAPGTGLWLNNCLGELELNHRGLVFAPPGTPVPSNMAPSCARRSNGASLAIGSPGADRITTALLQVMLAHFELGLPLAEAIAAPRLHLEWRDGWTVAAEPGLDLGAVQLPVRRFDEPSMFFGGVGATAVQASGELLAAADPRRAGGVWIAP